jgi:hypothetical protein
MPHSGIGWLRKTCSAALANSLASPYPLGGAVNRIILPSLNRCEACGKAESDHQGAGRPCKRNNSIPRWHRWHAARRGLGSNVNRLGVPEIVIQGILRHANVINSVTATYYIKTARRCSQGDDDAGKPHGGD